MSESPHDTPRMPRLTRRHLLQLSGAGWWMLHGGTDVAETFGAANTPEAPGLVIGHPQGAAAGIQVLANGGNAVDAIVAAALVAGVVAVPACGIGGYGGHAVIGLPGGKVSAIDFNSTAPAAAREDMYPLDASGRVRGRINQHGWLAAGVPGTLAGLQLAIDRFGTRRLERLIEPAIRLARDGFAVEAGFARATRNAAEQFARDPGSARLFLPAGRVLAEGETFRNPDLAAMLERLAKDNSVAAFYRGRFADQVAREFKKHGGLVTRDDLAAYKAREVAPLSLTWRGHTIHTAPLTAGGLSVLQILATLRALDWEKMDAADPHATHARVEAMRVAWHDRLALLGDPDAGDLPVDRLVSAGYAEQSAERVRKAVRDGQMIPGASDDRTAGGTVHLTAADKTGMMVALTLTHGEAFGAQVTVEGLGLVLGHGMSRFDPRPGYPNSPRPGCRPLNNMCPSVIVRDGRPVVALGAHGGRRIPNTLVDVLAPLIGRCASLADAYAAPRLHTEGAATLQLAKGWNDAQVDYLKRVGYTITTGRGASLNAIARDVEAGTFSRVPA